jgi:hypothetical protein
MGLCNAGIDSWVVQRAGKGGGCFCFSLFCDNNVFCYNMCNNVLLSSSSSIIYSSIKLCVFVRGAGYADKPHATLAAGSQLWLTLTTHQQTHNLSNNTDVVSRDLSWFGVTYDYNIKDDWRSNCLFMILVVLEM